MKNKKTKLLLISIITTLPVVALVSCSTTWTRWNVDDEVEDTEIIYESKTAPEILWKSRPIDEIKTAAWNDRTTTIDLNALNNQYELMDLLIEVLGLKSDVPMDEYWNDFEGMKDYLNAVTKNMQFLTLKYDRTTVVINWDVEDIINSAISGIDDYIASPDDSKKAYNVEANGLNANGQPNDFDQVATVGMALTNIPVVSNLLIEDGAFALALSKLVNLPKTTFDSFQAFLYKIDDMLTKVLESSSFNTWATSKNLDFTVSPTTGMIGAYAIDYAYERDDHFKGIFMLRALKTI